ncbi:MAG TPA: hypothetical protein VGH33_03610 [Isosphaeraceae bacterium]|jgi:hypothetical protein
MQPRPRQVVNCPHCAAVNPSHEVLCRACAKDLTVYIGPAERLPHRFGVGSLMLLVGSVGVGLGLFRALPVLGAGVLLLIPPALIRTMAAVSQRAGDGRPMGGDERMVTFFHSIGVTLGLLVCSLLTFAIVMMPAASLTAGAGHRGMVITLGLAGTAAGFVGWLLLRRLWPYKG